MSCKFNTTETKAEIITSNMSKESLALNGYDIPLYICDIKITKLKNMYRLEPYPLRLCLHGELQ